MTGRAGWLLGCVLLIGLGAGPAAAQFIDQTRVDRAPPAAAQPPQKLPALRPSILDDGVQFTLTAVQVSGASVPLELVDAATRPFIGKTIDAGAVQKIADAISTAYGSSQIALYAVVSPAQNYAGGVLKLIVFEGYIEHVELQGDDLEGRDLDLIKSYGVKLTAERPLRRSTLQRYVSLIRDIPGLKADIQLLAGSAQGAMRMVVKITQKDFKVSLGIRNDGNKLLGRTQVETDLAAYGLLRQGEQTTLSLGTATDFGRFQFVSLADAEPIGSDGTLAQATLGFLHTHATNNIRGEAETVQMVLVHPLLRSYDENINLSGDIDGINTTNALLDQTIANERVRAARIAMTYSLSSPKDLLSASTTLSTGFDGLDAHISVPALATPNFQKINATLGFNRLLAEDFVVRLKGTGQLADDRLPISEMMSLGGADYGRAFPVATIIGDSGRAVSAEIAWHPTAFPLAQLSGSELYGFYDNGQTWYRARGLADGATVGISSAGGGVRLAVFGDTSLQIEGARQLETPGNMKSSWVLNISAKSTQ